MAVEPRRNPMVQMPPLPELVQVEATSTDPAQSIWRDPRGTLHLSGVAAGLPGPGSEMALSFEGGRFSVSLREGMTCEDTVRLLQKVLPDGFRLSVTALFKDGLTAELVRRPRTLRPARPASASPSRGPARPTQPGTVTTLPRPGSDSYSA